MTQTYLIQLASLTYVKITIKHYCNAGKTNTAFDNRFADHSCDDDMHDGTDVDLGLPPASCSRRNVIRCMELDICNHQCFTGENLRILSLFTLISVEAKEKSGSTLSRVDE